MRKLLVYLLAVGLVVSVCGLCPVTGVLNSIAYAAPSAKKKVKQTKKKSSKKRRAPTGVRGKFSKANKLYNNGKYQQALVVYHSILSKFPGHEPSTIQYAKTLYRLDRIKDSFAVFARINPMHLNAETSYEYGWSFYTNKQWEGALYGFKRVPQGHALFDLANYYGGICAIKLKRYEESEDMFEKAMVLPNKLAKSRSVYLKHVQALRLMQQKSSLAKERKKIKNGMSKKGKKKSKTDKTKEKAPEPEEKKDEKYAHAGKKSIYRATSLSYSTVHQLSDNHGYPSTTFDTKVAEFSFSNGPLLPLPYKVKGGRQAAVGLQLWAAAESRISKGEEERVLIVEGDEDVTRVVVEDLGTSDTKAGKVSAGPWVEFPLPEDLWLALAGDFYFKYPEFSRGSRSGARSGTITLAGSGKIHSLSSSIKYSEVVDSETKPYIKTVGGSGSLSFSLPSALSVGFGIGHKQYEYVIKGLDGPDTSTSASVSVGQSLPLGFYVSLYGAFENQSNYIAHDLEKVGDAQADGQVMTGQLSLSAAPFSWISISVSELISKTEWKVDDPDKEFAFEVENADYFEQFSSKITLNLLF